MPAMGLFGVLELKEIAIHRASKRRVLRGAALSTRRVRPTQVFRYRRSPARARLGYSSMPMRLGQGLSGRVLRVPDLVVAVALLLSVAGCGASKDQLRARAAFDLNCPSSQVEIVTLDDRTKGVTGCGQRATYVENCGWRDGYGGKHDCTWVLNTDARKNSSAE